MSFTLQTMSELLDERNRLVEWLVARGWAPNHDFFEPPERLVTDSTKQELYTLDRAVICESESLMELLREERDLLLDAQKQAGVWKTEAEIWKTEAKRTERAAQKIGQECARLQAESDGRKRVLLEKASRLSSEGMRAPKVPCDNCIVLQHCEHHKRCLAECTPRDLFTTSPAPVHICGDPNFEADRCQANGWGADTPFIELLLADAIQEAYGSEGQMITIQESKTADTRSCDYANVSKETLLASSKQHISDVRRALDFFMAKVCEAGQRHDTDKITDIDGFHADFLTGFKRTEWWDRHRKLNRHHLLQADGVPADVNLIDVLDMIADCVMAGMARTGSVYPLEIPQDVLKRAFDNTVELLKAQIVVQRA